VATQDLKKRSLAREFILAPGALESLLLNSFSCGSFFLFLLLFCYAPGLACPELFFKTPAKIFFFDF
jgi:hypothetical protein